MRRFLMTKVRLLAAGGVTLGLIQGFGGINYAEILFEFLLSWVSILVNTLLGGDVGQLSGGIEGILS
jgi:hypothetical protein